MTERTTMILLATAVATSIFHTLIPDHWLPFVLIGRARNWTSRTTAAVSGFSALIHTALSVVLGWVALRIGLEGARTLGERVEEAGAVLLVVFGASYALWAWRKGGHFHPGGELLHRRANRPRCDGSEPELDPDHLHYHADEELIHGGADRGALYLAIIVGVNPCVLVLPLLMAAGRRGATALALVMVAYSATTTLCMVGLSVAGVRGSRGLRVPGAARHMEMASGLLIAIVGVVFFFLDS